MRDDSTGIRTRVSPWAIRWVAPTAAILRTFLVAALLCLKPSLPAAWAAAPESNKAAPNSNKAAPNSNKAAARSPAPAHDQRAKASQLKPRRPESGLPDTIPPKVYRYAEALVRQYDRNRDGVLDAQEWQQMHGNPALADADRDGAITLEEMVLWIVKYGQNRRIRLAVPPIGLGVDSQADEGEPPNPTVAAKPDAPAGAASSAADDGAPDLAELEESRRQAKFYVPSKRLPAGLPAWFLLRDEDGDGQLTLGEFAPKPTPADLRNFEQYDLNGDGLITPKECLRAVKSMKPSAKKPPTK